MFKSVSLAVLILLTVILGAPSHPDAQPADSVAPVPGPYQAMPTPRTMANPTSNPGMTRMLPYWMRPQQPPTGWAANGNPRRRQYISGWVWSPYAPNNAAYNRTPNSGGGQRYYHQQTQPMPGPAPGYRPGYQQPAYPHGRIPWGGNQPYPLYGAPQGYGAPIPPNQ